MHKRAIGLIRVLSVGGRSGARRTPRRRSSARTSNRPRAPAPTSSSTCQGTKASLAAPGFGAQSAIATADSARPGGRHQAHRVDHWSAPRAHHSRAARAPRVPRAPQGPGPRRRYPLTWQAAGQQRVKVPRPARRRPRKPPARPVRGRSRSTNHCPPTLTTSTTPSTPNTPTTRPSHTAHTAPPAANAETAPPQRPRRAATRDKQPSHQIRPPAAADPAPVQARRETSTGRYGDPAPCFVAKGIARTRPAPRAEAIAKIRRHSQIGRVRKHRPLDDLPGASDTQRTRPTSFGPSTKPTFRLVVGDVNLDPFVYPLGRILASRPHAVARGHATDGSYLRRSHTIAGCSC